MQSNGDLEWVKIFPEARINAIKDLKGTEDGGVIAAASTSSFG